ncbi:MAG: DUF1611 domain-containing protein [Bdellovibrionota bacterium]
MQDNRPIGGPAIVLASKALHTINAKTAHGLLRYSARFQIQAVVDSDHAGEAASRFLAGTESPVPIVPSVEQALALGPAKYALVGVATHGGVLPDALRADILDSLGSGLTLVNGLHRFLGEEAVFLEAASNSDAEIIDIRKPKPRSQLHFWSGKIFDVKAPRLAVLGMDCAIGKRTTARILVEACRGAGLRTEMIYTGQTGWMQGGNYGFILDSVPNDFVSGELEHAISSCDADLSPELIVLEGQSSLQNLSGPCGAELLLSGQAKGVVLQHAPGRKFLEGYEKQGFAYPKLQTEAELIRLYGSRLVAISINPQHLTKDEAAEVRQQLEREMGVPVLDPFAESERLVGLCREYANEN